MRLVLALCGKREHVFWKVSSMSSEWFYQNGQTTMGPATSAGLVRLVPEGTIRSDTLVNKGADGKSLRVENVTGLFTPPGAVPAAAPLTTPSPGPAARREHGFLHLPNRILEGNLWSLGVAGIPHSVGAAAPERSQTRVG